MKLETVLSLISLLMVTITGLLLWYQIRSGHEWSRRKATTDLLQDVVAGKFREMRRVIEAKVDPYQSKQSYADLKASNVLNDDDEKTLTDILNYLEHVAVAVKHNVLDGDYCYEMLYYPAAAYCRLAAGLMDDQKKFGVSIWVDLRWTISEWDKRAAHDHEKLRKEPKSKL